MQFHKGDIMRRSIILVSVAMALIFSGVYAANPALAGASSKSGGRGAEKSGEKETQGNKTEEKGRDQMESGERGEPGVKASQYFSEESRISVHKYYSGQFRSGHCPPGLAKKNNGCMPPGQAKKWMIGRPLPRDVIFHDLPPEVLVQLGPVPSRHRFVRVASDILMIAVGTGMVVDAIEDIGSAMGR
jgi:hypothetical protein